VPSQHLRFRTLVLLGALALVTIAGCGGGPTEPLDFDIGTVEVYVRDTQQQFVNGVSLRLDERNGRHVNEGTTGSEGTPGHYSFVTVSGDYRVVMILPTGYSLPPGQASSMTVTLEKHRPKTINFVLKKL